MLSLLVLAAVLTGCSGSAGKDSDDEDKPPPARSRASQAHAPGVVEISAEAQKKLSLVVEPVIAVTFQREVKGYGRVLDPGPLAALVAELATAQGAQAASEQELARLKSLQQQDNASARAVQAGEAATVRDRWLVQSARDRIALAWGASLARRADLPALVQTLTLQKREIVRIDVPAGEPFADPPSTARLVGLADESRSMQAELLGLTPATDPQMQGQGILYLTRDNVLRLVPEAAVAGYLAVPGEPVRGVRVPRSALIRYEAQPWVYIQQDESTFRRTAMSAMHPMEGGWLIPEGLKAGDRIVTAGAQVLLSEELKSQVRLGD